MRLPLTLGYVYLEIYISFFIFLYKDLFVFLFLSLYRFCNRYQTIDTITKVHLYFYIALTVFYLFRTQNNTNSVSLHKYKEKLELIYTGN